MSTISVSAMGAQSRDILRADVGRSARRGTFASFVATLLIIFAFVVPIAEAWKRSTYEHYDIGMDEMKTSVREGTLARQIAIGSLGLFGLVATCWPAGKVLRLRGILAILCVTYVAWCAASCLWSDDPGLSLKRWTLLMCESLGAMGIAKRCSVNQFVWIVFSCTLAWLGIGIVAEQSLGTFRPWEPGYRFAGVFHPNEMGINCALLTISALYLATNAERKSWILLAAAALGSIFLLLTHSRTALGSTVVALAVQWLVMAPSGKAFWRLTAVSIAAACVTIALALGLFADTSSLVSMGRDEDGLSTLTGRLPLWQELFHDYAQRRPLIGHGYGTFWSPEHIFEVSESQRWAVSSSHSTYIDLLLNVGYIGGALYVSTMIVAIVGFWRLEARYLSVGYGFMAIVVILVLTSGLLETAVSLASFLSFFGMCGVGYLIFDDDEDLRKVPQHANLPPVRNLENHKR